MRRAAEHIALFAAALACAGAALAQRRGDDVPPPPRLDPAAEAARLSIAPPTEPRPLVAAPGASIPNAGRPPNAATLAPLPEDRKNDKPEEIIVLGGWRLPDLGSGWRETQAAKDASGRFHTTFLPLYDPANPPYVTDDGVPLVGEVPRPGSIELFRMRFGRRPAK